MSYDIRPIASGQWLPDRCLRMRGGFDPRQAPPEAGCERLQGWFTHGNRDRLVALYEDCLLLHGCCGFVAWDGPLVVGYNTFFPRDWAPTRAVPGREGRQPGTLHHHCISVVEGEQVGEEAIAARLIRHTLDWARHNGWERFEVQAVLPTNPACRRALGVHNRAFWERLGLRPVEENDPGRPFDVIRSAAAIEGVRIETEADADAYHPDWRSEAIHYTMAIDLR